ncbi:DUF930 domain-containing protein [Roseibium sediminis]|uniref:DUF930 domain-containing protein n=1 Tax=Roseibium sediminis TaxID=1775174 RepID=UPI00123D848C|nr:DUF930 domain-containing protein [Roseibium sediminis]
MSLTCIPDQISVPLDGPSTVRQGSSFLLSVVMHLLLVTVFVWTVRTTPARPVSPPETAVEVTLVSIPSRYEPEKAPTSEPETEAVPSPSLPIPSQLPEDSPADPVEEIAVLTATRLPSGLARVRQIYANRILASDDGRAARAGLMTAYGEERWIQLCNLEALEQIANADPLMTPHQIIAHTRSPIVVKTNHISAYGAAVYSKDSWFDLQFECWFSEEDLELSDFAFRLGGKIPRRHWDSLWLPEPH